MGSEGQWDHQQVWSPGRFLASPKDRLGLGRAIILASDVVSYAVCLGVETGIEIQAGELADDLISQLTEAQSHGQDKLGRVKTRG